MPVTSSERSSFSGFSRKCGRQQVRDVCEEGEALPGCWVGRADLSWGEGGRTMGSLASIFMRTEYKVDLAILGL